MRREVIENKVEIPDFNATIAYTLGYIDEIIYLQLVRPFTLSDKGSAPGPTDLIP